MGTLGKVGFTECRPRRHSAKMIFKNKKKFAECLTLALGKISFKKLKKNCRVPKVYTRQNKFLKIINFFCRVPSVRHSAKSDGRCPPSRAGHLLPSGTFAECRGTRQSLDLPRARLCRVHGARQSHVCRVLYFVECGTRQNISLPSAPIKSTRQSTVFQ